MSTADASIPRHRGAPARIDAVGTSPRNTTSGYSVVELALRRPYTFIVMAMLIAIGGALTIARTPIDIFPEINIPVVSVIWQYNGLLPAEVASDVAKGRTPPLPPRFFPK